jgi:hypothetical protein
VNGRGGGIHLGNAASRVDLGGRRIIKNNAHSGGGIGMVTNNLHDRIFVEHDPLAENAVFNGNRASGARWYITPALAAVHDYNISIERDQGHFSMRLTSAEPGQTGFMHHAYNNYDIMYPTDREDAYPEITVRQWSEHDVRWFYDPANPNTSVTTVDPDGNPWRTEAELPGVPPTGNSATTTLTMVIENTGNSVLQNLTFTQDSITAPLATPWVCGPDDEPIQDYLDEITYFMVGDIITCTATVPSINYDASFTSVVTVEGEVDYLDNGQWRLAEADDSHIWHAIVVEAGEVRLRVIMNPYRLRTNADPGDVWDENLALYPRGALITMTDPEDVLSPGDAVMWIVAIENYGTADAYDDIELIVYLPCFADFRWAQYSGAFAEVPNPPGVFRYYHDRHTTVDRAVLTQDVPTGHYDCFNRFVLNVGEHRTRIPQRQQDGYAHRSIIEIAFFTRISNDVTPNYQYRLLSGSATVSSGHSEEVYENNWDGATVRVFRLWDPPTDWLAMQLPFTGGAGPVTWLLLGLAGALGLMLALKKRATA